MLPAAAHVPEPPAVLQSTALALPIIEITINSENIGFQTWKVRKTPGAGCLWVYIEYLEKEILKEKESSKKTHWVAEENCNSLNEELTSILDTSGTWY